VWQEIIITDVTRMKDDRVCVAGVDKKGNCLRPLLPYPDQLREHHLYDNDGKAVIRPRAVLNMFLSPEVDPKPPHIEDHHWPNPNQVEYLRQPDDKIWKLVLERTASNGVGAIFKTTIRKNKYVAPGDGERSLGTIRPASINKLGYYRIQFDGVETDKFSLNFTDVSGEDFNQIPVTDLSLRYYLTYLRVQKRMHQARIREMLERKWAASEVWLRLGLTRPFQKSEDSQKWCYLQVTGIYTFPDYLDGKCFADFKPAELPALSTPARSPTRDYAREGQEDFARQYGREGQEWNYELPEY
jgi:hypothetical protein